MQTEHRAHQTDAGNAVAAPFEGHWPAAIRLAFRHDGATTRMHRLGGFGPLYVQKPFYPEPDVCHTYLLHPPGGVAGGDVLHTELTLEANSRALLTTPAATKYLRSRGPVSKTIQQIRVAEGAALEYLPQESIVFNDAKAQTETRIELTGSARMIAWDVVSLGRPAIHEPLQSGSFTQRLRIDRFDLERQRPVPLLIDQQRWQGGGIELRSAWGLQKQPVLGTLIAAPVDQDMLQLLRQQLAGRQRSDVPVLTLINGVLVARTLGVATETVSMRLRELWQTLRPLLLQRTAQAPNIWHT